MLVTKDDAYELALSFYKSKYGKVTSKTTEIELLIRSELLEFARFINQTCPPYTAAGKREIHNYIKKKVAPPAGWFKYVGPVFVDFLYGTKWWIYKMVFCLQLNMLY